MKQPVEIDPRFLRQLHKDGILHSDAPSFQMLTGGVSSEIYRVKDGTNDFVIKRALEKLKVEADWYANVSRNKYEVDYLAYVGRFLPESVPRILGRGGGYFVMEYLDRQYENWKVLLIGGSFELEQAKKAGEVLGRIHEYSAGDLSAAQQFDSVENFIQLRISPYLYRIAEIHPELADVINLEAERLVQTRECLIHGDFSPKNILTTPERMVLVDCEVAFYGDPAFDVAFLLTHLLLKGLLHVRACDGLHRLTKIFMATYQHQRSREKYDLLHPRLGKLLMMLMLARVDGKSPVEYLNPDQQAIVRAFTVRQLVEDHYSLEERINHWFKTIKETNISHENKIN